MKNAALFVSFIVFGSVAAQAQLTVAPAWRPVNGVPPAVAPRATPARAVKPVRPIGGGAYGRDGYQGGYRVYQNVQKGEDSTHRPWVGSDTYEKNLAKRSQDNGRADFQRDRDATLDVYHREEDRVRRLQQEDELRAEQRETIRANKAVIEANLRAAEAERRAREAERNAEIKQRAAEQELETLRRRDEQEKVHDASLQALPPCSARLADGRPCPRKSNPGSHFCYLHLDWKAPAAEPAPQQAP